MTTIDGCCGVGRDAIQRTATRRRRRWPGRGCRSSSCSRRRGRAAPAPCGCRSSSPAGAWRSCAAACDSRRAWSSPGRAPPASWPGGRRPHGRGDGRWRRCGGPATAGGTRTRTASPATSARPDICDPVRPASRPSRGRVPGRAGAGPRGRGAGPPGPARAARGSMTTRSLSPLPWRTVSWLRSRSMSLTRSRQHSMTRSPAPYISRVIRPYGSVVGSRSTASRSWRTSSGERTTGRRRLRRARTASKAPRSR